MGVLVIISILIQKILNLLVKLNYLEKENILD